MSAFMFRVSTEFKVAPAETTKDAIVRRGWNSFGGNHSPKINAHIVLFFKSVNLFVYDGDCGHQVFFKRAVHPHMACGKRWFRLLT